MEIRVRNVNQALPQCLGLLEIGGVDRDSRNGKVRLFPEPVTTIYERPRERVLFDERRDCNPFFHLFESLWMLAGRDDVAFVKQFVKRMATFSDDGRTLHGAYGRRWNGWFTHASEHSCIYQEDGRPIDQLQWAVDQLRANPDNRRVVIQMWDASTDIEKASNGGKDVPCNTHIYVWIDTEGALSMTLCNRSNDIVWGAYGANAVHFTMLQEFLAAGVGVPVGQLYQGSNNLHAYHDTLEQVRELGHEGYNPTDDPYAAGEVEPYPLVSVPWNIWREDLQLFMDEGPVVGFRDPFFRRVATPMWVAHLAYKDKDDPERFAAARMALDNCHAKDWQLACRQWLDRREDAARLKAQAAE